MDEWSKALKLAQEQYESASKLDLDNYKNMLSHYTTKAGKEQAASGGVRMNNGKVSTSAAKTSVWRIMSRALSPRASMTSPG